MINFLFIQLQGKAVSTSAERYLLIYMIAVLVIVTFLVILFFVVFQKRKNKLLLDKVKQQQDFENEIAQVQTEIQEQTLKNIGWELHDNVGQLLSFASMQLSLLKMQMKDDVKDKFKDTSEALKQSLNEVRSLSRALNNEVVLNIGFEESITNELNRLNKMKFATAKLISRGQKIKFTDRKHEIVIFRILQEFLSNSVKHSEAKNLKILLEYNANHLLVTASDDGKGYDTNSVKSGSGLMNMRSRAKLIHSEIELTSKENQGASLVLKYPFQNI